MTHSTPEDILGPVDSAFWYIEKPETPMNIGAVTIFEGEIDYDTLLAALDDRIHQAPIYQKKIIQAPYHLGQPVWVFDPDFHVRNHVFQMDLPAPGAEEQLRETAGALMSNTLDRDKPLWEVHLMNGLQGDRTAIFFKVHHCMVDGLAAVELFTMLMDFTPEPTPPTDRPLYDPPLLPDKPRMVLDALRNDTVHKFNIAKLLGHDLSMLKSAIMDKEKRRQTMMGVANLINDNLRPIKKLPINGKNSGDQAMAWVEFPLDEVRQIKKRVGASVNDVMLTILARAVNAYTQSFDGKFEDFLRVLVPVNMRENEEKIDFGNRVSVMPVDIAFDINKPLDHLKAVSDYTSVMKQSSLSITLDMVLTLPSFSPSVVQPLIWAVAPGVFSSIAHTWCTNVASSPVPVYLQGHRMLHTYGFFPLNPSMGLACVVVSYNGQISMNLIADQAIVPDVTALMPHMQAAFDELCAAAGVKVAKHEPEVQVAPVPESVYEPEPALVTANGASARATSNGRVPNAALVDDAEITMETPEPIPEVVDMSLFSADWVSALETAINDSMDYRKASTKWKAGSLAMIIQASPRNGLPNSRAILLDLHKGVCREGRTISPAEAERDAAFVIEGSYDTWMKVLNGKAQPLAMIIRGKLRLKQGSVAALMPFTKSASELIRCAQMVEKNK